jgi:2-dehydropantoate 2-reductase
VVTAQNGLPWWFTDRLDGAARGLRLPAAEAGGALRAAVPTPQVIGAVLHLAASVPAPGQVHHAGGDGIILGLPGGARAEAATGAQAEPAAQALPHAAALLADAGFTVTVAERIEREIWFKLWGNMTLNPVSALTGATCDRILDDELLRGFVSAVMREAQALGAAIGLPIAQTPEERHAVTRKLGAFRTSMLQDREAGRPLEIDALVAAPHELARALGLPTPQLDALLGLARVLAQTPPAARR